ncbi:cytochrome P450 [Marasmius fiardii PR-910]|nr:cytochrome P450 [Marasmius fiardii PR-910]
MTPLILLLVASCLFLWRWIRARQRGTLPPGPPPWPITGNILKLPSEEPWLALTDMKEKYGDIVYLHGLGNKVLVLNSLKAIDDLLNKKSGIYSGRPFLTVACELMGLDRGLVLMDFGQEWREQRKLAHIALSPTAVKKYQIIQEDIAVLLCRDILEKPEDFYSLARLSAGRIVMSITYGLSVPLGNKYVDLADTAMGLCASAAVPGTYLVDTIPILKYFPSWMPFHRQARKGRDAINAAIDQPYGHFIDELRQGIARPSLAHDISSGDTEMDDVLTERVKWVLGVMYIAGSETTHGVTVIFLLAMALYPDKQRIAQAELDRLLDAEKRMPLLSDLPRLPYLNALVKETLRWQPVVPLSVARKTTEESEYDGYTIPKGTIVIPNVWSIAFDPDGHHDPHEFIPERFLSTNSQPPPDPATYVFGFGKRICPGKPLAEGSVFIIFASILATFDISLPEETLKHPPVFQSRLSRSPKPFKCNIVPRSNAHVERMKRRAEQCQS